MNITEVREIIRQVIKEAKEGGLPKSGGKLVHLKKEMEGLKRMKESLGQLQISEGGDQSFVAEYAHMQKFVNELEKIKVAHAKLSEMLDKQIGDVDTKIQSETQKIKEMVGLVEPAAKKMKDEAKKEPKEKKEKDTAHEKGETKAQEKEEHTADKKKAKDLDEARFEKGTDIGKPGAGFKKVAKAAEKEYGSKEAGQKVAGAILKKVMAKK
jgi:hypothetical protein